jgi:hypothetical protein
LPQEQKEMLVSRADIGRFDDGFDLHHPTMVLFGKEAVVKFIRLLLGEAARGGRRLDVVAQVEFESKD